MAPPRRGLSFARVECLIVVRDDMTGMGPGFNRARQPEEHELVRVSLKL